jgi:hypothetical protein
MCASPVKENVIDTGFSTGEHQKQSNTIISNRNSEADEFDGAVSTATSAIKKSAAPAAYE